MTLEASTVPSWSFQHFSWPSTVVACSTRHFSKSYLSEVTERINNHSPPVNSNQLKKSSSRASPSNRCRLQISKMFATRLKTLKREKCPTWKHCFTLDSAAKKTDRWGYEKGQLLILRKISISEAWWESIRIFHLHYSWSLIRSSFSCSRTNMLEQFQKMTLQNKIRKMELKVQRRTFWKCLSSSIISKLR